MAVRTVAPDWGGPTARDVPPKVDFGAVRLTPEQADWVRAEAARCRIGARTVIRRAVRWYMEEMLREVIG